MHLQTTHGTKYEIQLTGLFDSSNYQLESAEPDIRLNHGTFLCFDGHQSLICSSFMSFLRCLDLHQVVWPCNFPGLSLQLFQSTTWHGAGFGTRGDASVELKVFFPTRSHILVWW